MSITAQVDTSSIQVSLDMHELRTEIAEVIGDEVPDMIIEGVSQAGESYISVVNNQAKDIDALKLEIKGIKDQLLRLEEDTRDTSRLLNEVVSRIVTAGCNLTGTILNHAREE